MATYPWRDCSISSKPSASKIWQPDELAVDALLSLPEQNIDPARIEPANVPGVIEESGDWLDAFDFLESWFEADAEIESGLEPCPAKRTERCLWTAL